MRHPPLPSIRDERGATILEFGLILPIFSVMLLGGFDIAHTLYMQGILQGSVQKAARDSGLEAARDDGTSTTQTRRDALDAKVADQVHQIARNATVTFNRRLYKSFTAASQRTPEAFTDSASGLYADGLCNNGESYTDANNNHMWDADGADAGQGSAKDDVLYTVTVSYPRMFPLDKLIGGNGTTTLTASTVLANQPYDTQAGFGPPTVRSCT
jgi:Flp pilus assembly protein TadG